MAEPGAVRRRDPLVLATRPLALLAGVAGSAAWFPVIASEFEHGVWLVIGLFAGAGAALGVRMLPPVRRNGKRPPGGLDPLTAARIRSSFYDAGILTAISIAGAYLANAIVGSWGPESWPLPAVVQLFMLMGLLGGIIIGILVLMPLLALVRLLVGLRRESR